MKIAILGWGSLIWDNQPKFENFNNQVDQWQNDGPALKLEFSRISSSRGDALTLVVDEENGELCKVQYAMSKRKNPEDAICDLRNREGTIKRLIGYYFIDDRQKGEPDIPESIKKWASEKEMDVVIWTGLKSNFKDKSKLKRQFSIPNAITHIQSLSAENKAKAFEYVYRAPGSIDTPLRRALQKEPWFVEA